MALRLTLSVLFSILALTACDRNGDHEHNHHPEQTQDADGETRAYYGDEQPVSIESLPDDHHGHDHDSDHGHDHDHDDDHSHDHDGEHDHDHGSHSHDH